MKKSQKTYLFFKRTIDIVVSFFGIVFCFAFFWWWIILINAFVTNGQPFFKEEFLGKRRKHFKIITFRTILSNECLTLKANDIDAENGLETSFGRFLKKSKLVSTPILINIFVGDMSFVGPRPVNLNNEYTLVLEREKGHPNAYDIKPGIKSYAILKSGAFLDSTVEAKYDTQYTQKLNFFFDCKLFFARSLKKENNKTKEKQENVVAENATKKKAISTNKPINCFFVVLSFLAATLGSALIYTGTINYKLDKLAFKINDYNNHYYTDDFKRPYVKVEKKNANTLYDDLFAQFYYSDDSGSVRQYMNNDTKIMINGLNTKNVTLFSQATFAIQNNIAADGGYRIDYGLFHAYFSDNELGGTRSYVGKHFNCDSYIFISDTIADKLLEYYNLPRDEENKTKSYLKLIQNEEYSVLSVRVDNHTNLKFSINNILYSDKRSAPRCTEFNNYFGLINHMYVSNYYKPCFEIDFKSYSYYITSVLNKINKLGYNTDNSDFEFYTYNYENNKYFLNQNVTAQFNEIPSEFNNNVFNILFICFFLIFGILNILFIIYSIGKKGDFLFCAFFEGLWLVIYSILGNFIYTCYAFTLVPIFFLIILLIMKGDLLFGPKRDEKLSE